MSYSTHHIKKREPIRLSCAILIGGDEGTRTPGLLTASQTRSQLRHTPKNFITFGHLYSIMELTAKCKCFLKEYDKISLLFYLWIKLLEKYWLYDVNRRKI